MIVPAATEKYKQFVSNSINSSASSILWSTYSRIPARQSRWLNYSKLQGILKGGLRSYWMKSGRFASRVNETIAWIGRSITVVFTLRSSNNNWMR